MNKTHITQPSLKKQVFIGLLLSVPVYAYIAGAYMYELKYNEIYNMKVKEKMASR